MNIASYLAKRILKSDNTDRSTSKPVVKIAITGIALGVMAMLLSVMIVTGFRNEVSKKIVGFMADIHITKFNSNSSFEETPFSSSQKFLTTVKKIPGVKHIQSYSYKAGILKASDDIQGVVLKGTGKDFDWDFFKSKLTSGQIPSSSDSSFNEVLISKSIAEKLLLKAGDDILVFFIQKDRKVRKLKVSGIYDTGLSEEFDNVYVLCRLELIQKINNWSADEVGGYEVFLNNSDDLEKTTPLIYNASGLEFNTKTIRDLYPQMFNWLELQNLNVIIIIVLISLVAGITMVSTLLILLLENSRQIGLLKSMGAKDSIVNKTFSIIAINILLKGLLIGNLIGLGLAFLQSRFNFIKLDIQSYYISSVPINFTVSGIIIINFATFSICMLMLLLPAKMISKIDPVKVIRFD